MVVGSSVTLRHRARPLFMRSGHAVGTLRSQAIGQLNHSDGFFFSFRDSIFAELHHRLTTFLETPQPAIGGLPPPLAVAADKMTALRRTNQVAVFLVLDYVHGCIVAVFAGARVIKDGSGDGTATNIVEVLTVDCKLKHEALKKQVAGQAYDGAYHHCNVPRELASKLGHPSEKYTLAGWCVCHLPTARIRTCACVAYFC